MIYNEDCLEGMKKIPDGTVDLVLTDLPFNMTDCGWDKREIDLRQMWEEFKRILKPCCSAVLFASGKFAHKLIASNFDWYKYKWIWVKNQATMFVQAKNAPMRKFEEILVFSDGVINHATVSKRRMKYNPQGVRPTEKLKSNARKDSGVTLRKSSWARSGRLRAFGSVIGSRPSHVDFYIQEQTGYPSDVLNFNAPCTNKRYHPTQKPVELLEYLIRTYTFEGETVLDATMGSGSTGVACVNLNRKFIGFELDEKYYSIAEKRIAEAVAAREQSLFR